MVERFGFLTVCFMVVFYALEGKAAIFTLAFAGACLCAAIYAFLIESFPFMIAEGVWSMVALRKWMLRSPAEP
ncbi:MAG: hypothetical protein AAFR21_18730 [Pseudomonadota bacterium]